MSGKKTKKEPAGTALGIDVGGTGIKGGVVDLAQGTLVSDRFRLATPQPALPDAVASTIGEIAGHFEFDGPAGVDFPGVIVDGTVHTAANVDPTWIGTSLAKTVGPLLPGPSVFLNDADAAGLAEVRYGAGRGHRGLVIVVTLGTGIGTALIYNGKLVPNGELGHIEIGGNDAETSASARAREREELSWGKWAKRVSAYLQHMERLLWPELFILGGGVSKKPDKFMPRLTTRTPVVVAELVNNAGIIGAALAAQHALDDAELSAL